MADSGAPWNRFVISDNPGAVRINADAIKQARQSGSSDDEIANHLAEKYPTLLLDHLSGAAQQQPRSQDLPPIPDGFQLEEGPGTKSQKQPASQSGGRLMFDDLPKGPTRPDGSPLQFDDLPPMPEGYELETRPGQVIASGTVPVKSGVPGLAKAAGAGVVSGVADLPGDVVSLINLGRKGYSYVIGGQYDDAKDNYSLGPTYQKVRAAADNLYQPQDSTEAWMKTAGLFYPAILSGPESIAGKSGVEAAKILAKRTALQAALPAAASEIAGKATEGTEAEPYARAAAALLTGHLGTRSTPSPISSEAVGDLATKAFDDFRSAPVHVKADVVENAAKDIQNTLAAKGLKFAPANGMVEQYIGNSTPVTLNQLQETRSLLGKAANRSDTPEGVAAMHAKQGIDALMDGLSANDIAVGANALPQAMTDLRQGRAYTALAKQLEALEGAQYKAKLNVDTSHHSDYDAAQRQQLRSLLINRKAMNKLEPWRGDIEKITKGTVGVNALKTLGTLTGGAGGWHGSPWWLAALLAEPFSGTAAAASAAMPFVGLGLRKLQGKAAEGQVNALRAKVASGMFPNQQPTISPLVARALIASRAMNGNIQ